jgi:hypothetical protein
MKSLKIIHYTLITILLFSGYSTLSAEKKENSANSFTVKKLNKAILIDGVIDETEWENCQTIDLPYEWSPGDNIPALVKTDCFIAYDKSNLYIAFRCFDTDPLNIRAHYIERDAINTFIQDDHVTINIDPFNDQRRAFKFCSNPYGVQVDGIYSDIDRYEDFSWDALWKSAGKITEYGYNVEFAIPFNQLRFNNSTDVQTWRFSFQRSFPRNVRHRFCSHEISRNNTSIISQFNQVVGFENISSGHNLEFDPTLTTIRFDEVDMQTFPESPMKHGKIKFDPGLTAKWGITPNMVLNATINPDFSQIEADALQLDVNTRYALFYPEKRPFFMEGADYFLTPMNTIFTRSVADPIGGTKITGKIGSSSIGLIATQDNVNNFLLPSINGSGSASIDEKVNGTALRYRFDLGSNSAIGLVYTGRMGDSYFNHLGGVDAFIKLGQSNSITLQYLHTQTNYSDSVSNSFNQKYSPFGGEGISLGFNHYSNKWAFNVQGLSLTDGFRSDFGFIPRVGQRELSTYSEYHFWGNQNSWFNQINVFGFANFTSDQDFSLYDRQLGLGTLYLGPRQSVVQVTVNHNKEYYNQTMFDLLYETLVITMKPVRGLSYGVTTTTGDVIDYINSRKSYRFTLAPNIELNLGKHINLKLSHSLEYLSNQGNKVYTANISQSRIALNISTKVNFLANLQYRSVSRNINQYELPVSHFSNGFNTQFVFSYKYNPRTLLYLGYSNKSIGTESIDLQQTNQTFFMKLGYAFGV